LSLASQDRASGFDVDGLPRPFSPGNHPPCRYYNGGGREFVCASAVKIYNNSRSVADFRPGANSLSRDVAMPIRFRCAYCNQLMGIARRKAGTVVSCPNCSGQVVVPTEDAVDPIADTTGPTASPRDASQPLFERGDFDDLFRSGKGAAPPPMAPPPPTSAGLMPAPPPAPKPTAPAPAMQQPMMAPPRLDLSTPAPAPPVSGYVISSSMATLLTVALIVALALAFTAGLLVGRFYLQPSDEAKPPVEGLYKTELPTRV
jgi:phage FluMu protein Com